MLERRGSIAPELDHHPKNWTGKDEARFRYSEKLDAEPGYRWTLDENGDLRYDRLDAALPGREYNTATGMFQEAVEGKDTLIKATKGVEEAPRPVATEIPKKQREAMEAAFKKRGDFIAKRDELEALKDAGTISKKDSEKLRKIYAQINEESFAADGRKCCRVAVMKGQKGGKRVYPTGQDLLDLQAISTRCGRRPTGSSLSKRRVDRVVSAPARSRTAFARSKAPYNMPRASPRT